MLIYTNPGCYEYFFTLSEVFLWTMQLSISGKSWAARKGHVAANFSETQQHLCAIQELTVINKKRITKIAREKKNLQYTCIQRVTGVKEQTFKPPLI